MDPDGLAIVPATYVAPQQPQQHSRQQDVIISSTRSYVAKLGSDPDWRDVGQRLYHLCQCRRCTAASTAVDVPPTFIQSYLQTNKILHVHLSDTTQAL